MVNPVPDHTHIYLSVIYYMLKILNKTYYLSRPSQMFSTKQKNRYSKRFQHAHKWSTYVEKIGTTQFFNYQVRNQRLSFSVRAMFQCGFILERTIFTWIFCTSSLGYFCSYSWAYNYSCAGSFHRIKRKRRKAACKTITFWKMLGFISTYEYF